MFHGANDIIKKAIHFAGEHAKVESNNAINSISHGIRMSLRQRAENSPELKKLYMRPTPKKNQNGEVVKDSNGNIQYDDKVQEFAPTDWELAESLLRDRKGNLHMKRAAVAGAIPILSVAGITDILD